MFNIEQLLCVNGQFRLISVLHLNFRHPMSIANRIVSSDDEMDDYLKRL